MKKKLLIVLLVMSLLAISAPLSAQAASAPAAVVLNGERLNFDVDPVVVQSRVLVPLRAIFESLGASLEYLPASQTIIADRGSKHIELQIGSTSAYVNGALVTLDVPAQAVDGRTMVPLRFIAESLEAKVNYKKDTNTVTITFKENQDTSTGIYYATMCEGVDESSWSPINETSTFSLQADRLYSYAVLTQPLNGTMTAKWYYTGNGSREYITEYSVAGEGVNDIFYFWINNSIFKAGSWECDLLINGSLATTLGFTISDSSDYGTIDFLDGVYTGYLENGVPAGTGTWVSSSGHSYYGYFVYSSSQLDINQAEVEYANGDFAYCDISLYSDGSSYCNGYYYYENGDIFDGEWLFDLDGSMYERGTYYYSDGTSEYVNTLGAGTAGE